MADLQDIISRLKAQNAEPYSNHAHTSSQPSLWAPAQIYHHSTASSPSFPPKLPPDRGQSPNLTTPLAVGPDQERSNKLLNLLKFNGQPGQSSPASTPLAGLQNISSPRTPPVYTPPASLRDASTQLHNVPVSDTDASKDATAQASLPPPLARYELDSVDSPKPPSNTQQDFLLNLLRKPQAPSPPPYTGTPAEFPPFRESPYTARNGLHTPKGVSDISKEPGSLPGHQVDQSSPIGNDQHATFVEAPSAPKPGMFSYINPFEQLHSSSPLSRTPQPDTPVERKPIEILKHDRESSLHQPITADAPADKSRNIESDTIASDLPAANGSSQPESISENAGAVGEAVGSQAEKTTAHNEPGNITAKLPSPIHASSPPGTTNGNHIEDDGVESNWESIEEEHNAKQEELKVEVFNFPMKPFVSLQLKARATVPSIRVTNLMTIAHLKKDFDQIDRCLSTASQTHILYAQVATKKDNGGFRIIRQDTGDHKQVFRTSGERVFSVQLCNSTQPGHDVEAVIGTGVNGSVFWTSLAKSRGEFFADDDVEAQGFVMPPVATLEENTSGAPVKTRAKMSSRHPEFFAVARGKHIYLITPETVKLPAYRDPVSRRVNSEKYFEEHGLKINTGKAGKDFCFSEDDSVIASLDKNGRFKFWDIRDLTVRALNERRETHGVIELREPLWTMNAAASGTKPDEKPSVSSIMFLDKERPMSKGFALRYMIIGFRQNHIVQLWDLGLGKAVQEIRLPHDKDGDGICSINYHPKTGIVAIAHPTRNSIYFIHLSAPKYNIPQMEQARFISMLAQEDPTLPKPESTAIMSGLREFTFDKVGKLRSVDMLRTPVENASERDSQDETLFELYVMHSRGVVCLNIKRDDLGWDVNNKMLYAKNALDEGIIEISELTQPPKLPETSTQPEVLPKAPPKSVKKEEQAIVNDAAAKLDVEKEVPAKNKPADGDVERTAAGQTARPVSSTVQSEADQHVPTESKAVPPTKIEARPAKVEAPKVSQPTPQQQPQLEDFQILLGKEFDTLYRRIDTDKRVHEAAAGANQQAILRLVSSTLTDNVDRALTHIVTKRIEEDVVPKLSEITAELIDNKLTEMMPGQLESSITNAFKTSFPGIVHTALKDKDVKSMIADASALKVMNKVERQVSNLHQQSLPKIVTEVTQKLMKEFEQHIKPQFQQLEEKRQKDNAQIDELTKLVRSLSATIEKMSESQNALREEMVKLQAKAAEDATGANAAITNITSTGAPPESDDPEIAKITKMLVDGNYEQATIEWIGSSRQAELFDKLFIRINPEYLLQVSPLVALTVSAAITSSLETYVDQRLEWLGKVLALLDMSDNDIRDVAPKIMEVISQRLQAAYMNLSEANSNDYNLKTISQLNRQVQEIRRVSG